MLEQQLFRRFVVALRRLDVQRSAVDGQQPAVVTKLVAFGVPAEIVVIVENQHARVASGVLEEVVGRAQSADAAAHHHQIIGLVGVRHRRQIHAARLSRS